jgi:hypothetical protein
MCVCVCLYIYTHIYIYIIYKHISIHTYTHTYINAHTHRWTQGIKKELASSSHKVVPHTPSVHQQSGSNNQDTYPNQQSHANSRDTYQTKPTSHSQTYAAKHRPRDIHTKNDAYGHTTTPGRGHADTVDRRHDSYDDDVHDHDHVNKKRSPHHTAEPREQNSAHARHEYDTHTHTHNQQGRPDMHTRTNPRDVYARDYERTQTPPQEQYDSRNSRHTYVAPHHRHMHDSVVTQTVPNQQYVENDDSNNNNNDHDDDGQRRQSAYPYHKSREDTSPRHHSSTEVHSTDRYSHASHSDARGVVKRVSPRRLGAVGLAGIWGISARDLLAAAAGICASILVMAGTHALRKAGRPGDEEFRPADDYSGEAESDRYRGVGWSKGKNWWQFGGGVSGNGAGSYSYKRGVPGKRDTILYNNKNRYLDKSGNLETGWFGKMLGRVTVGCNGNNNSNNNINKGGNGKSNGRMTNLGERETVSEWRGWTCCF